MMSNWQLHIFILDSISTTTEHSTLALQLLRRQNVALATVQVNSPSAFIPEKIHSAYYPDQDCFTNPNRNPEAWIRCDPKDSRVWKEVRLTQAGAEQSGVCVFHGRDAGVDLGSGGQGHFAWYLFQPTSFRDDTNWVDFLVNMSASADVLAQAKVEIGLGAIPEGKNVRVSGCNW